MSKVKEVKTPGEILVQDYLEPLGVTPYRLSKSIKISQARLGHITRSDKPIRVTADMAMRLGRFFNNEPEYWLALQAKHDIASMQEEKLKEIETIEPHVNDR